MSNVSYNKENNKCSMIPHVYRIHNYCQTETQKIVALNYIVKGVPRIFIESMWQMQPVELFSRTILIKFGFILSLIV